MTKKVNLPLFSDPAIVATPAKEIRKKPSIDAARARLGGRITEIDMPLTGFVPGVIVTFPSPAGARRSAEALEAAGRQGNEAAGVRSQDDRRRMLGVVVFASRSEVHVLLDGVRLRRLPPSDVTVADVKDVSDEAVEIEKIAGDARLFGQLAEGQAVRYADDAGSLVSGKLIEKCRWGALVQREDGAVVAVGFRKLWPLRSGGDA